MIRNEINGLRSNLTLSQKSEVVAFNGDNVQNLSHFSKTVASFTLKKKGSHKRKQRKQSSRSMRPGSTTAQLRCDVADSRPDFRYQHKSLIGFIMGLSSFAV
jgi:hypothetical protein